MKKRIIVVLAAALLMTIGCSQTEKQEEGHSSMIITSDNEVVSAYRDGEDVTEERKLLEEQTKNSIGRFLNRDKDELEFSMFCMLEMDGMTIEVIVNEVSYIFTCSMQGDIISMGRTDGERFGLRRKCWEKQIRWSGVPILSVLEVTALAS